MYCSTILLLLATTVLQQAWQLDPNLTRLGPAADESKPRGLCKTEGTCVCHFDNHYKIDLNPLGEEFPRLSVTGLQGFNYTYQPCSDFTTTLCKTATAVGSLSMVCQSNNTVGVNCGRANDTRFVSDNYNQTSLQYGNGDKVNGKARKSLVLLVCNKSSTAARFTALGDFYNTDVYEFRLVSKYCCPVRYQSSNFSMSVGSLLIIVFFSLLVVYFMGGALYMKFGRGAKGKEIIPNQQFWSSLPGLIKDGLMFITQPCQTSHREYEKL